MSDYKLDITGQIGLNEYSNIHDYIGIVDKNDKFTISLDDVQNKNIDIICTMLKGQEFNIIEQGSGVDGKYYIYAVKKK